LETRGFRRFWADGRAGGNNAGATQVPRPLIRVFKGPLNRIQSDAHPHGAEHGGLLDLGQSGMGQLADRNQKRRWFRQSG